MFANKVVLVTGGSSGIGACTAECFAKEGAILAIVGRNEAKLQQVAQRCRKLGSKVLTIKADVSKDEEAKTIVKQTVHEFGKLDVLVNNAGILRFATIRDSNVVEIFDEIMNTNLRSIILLTNLAVPHLQESKGNIVNVSSVCGLKVLSEGIGAYSMSKAAMDHFTRASAIELASSGVRVNSINPGPVTTALSNEVEMPDALEDVTKLTLLGRSSEGTEIGDLILYLASNKARGVTGSCFLTDNGMQLK